jgi:hypothetical protein
LIRDIGNWQPVTCRLWPINASWTEEPSILNKSIKNFCNFRVHLIFNYHQLLTSNQRPATSSQVLIPANPRRRTTELYTWKLIKHLSAASKVFSMSKRECVCMRQRLLPVEWVHVWRSEVIAVSLPSIWQQPVKKITVFFFRLITIEAPRNSNPAKNILILNYLILKPVGWIR